jgi:hypothetical protein
MFVGFCTVFMFSHIYFCY